MTQPPRPLLTFTLFTYNQENYVRDALQGAFSQTYSPLEILISDDGSVDATPTIIADEVAQYQGGHQVRVFQNQENLGWAPHVNRMMAHARGELILFAAGDDISLPERAARVYDAWCNAPEARSLVSRVQFIDQHGRPVQQEDQASAFTCSRDQQDKLAVLSQFMRDYTPMAWGCAHVMHRSLWDVFGSLPDPLTYEDQALSFRALILGRVVAVDDVLVQYRVHDANIHRWGTHGMLAADRVLAEDARLFQRFDRAYHTVNSFLLDLDIAEQKKLLPGSDVALLRREGMRLREIHESVTAYRDASFGRRLKLLRTMRRLDLDRRTFRRLVVRLVPRVIRQKTKTLREYLGT